MSTNRPTQAELFQSYRAICDEEAEAMAEQHRRQRNRRKVLEAKRLIIDFRTEVQRVERFIVFGLGSSPSWVPIGMVYDWALDWMRRIHEPPVTPGTIAYALTNYDVPRTIINDVPHFKVRLLDLETGEPQTIFRRA